MDTIDVFPGQGSFSREVCESTLAHRLPDGSESARWRDSFVDKRVLLILINFASIPHPLVRALGIEPVHTQVRSP